MMNQQKTNKAGILKYSLIVPLALALILSSNAQTVINKAKESLTFTKEETSVKKTSPMKSAVKLTATFVKDDTVTTEKTWDVVEKMPQFPGGEKALINYISQNLKYPKEAMEKGGQGTVIIRFTINSKGKVINPIFLKSTVSEDNKEVGSSSLNVVELLNNEALRVINSLPDFIPGEQNGKKVAVWYTLPITFKLDDTKPNEKETADFMKSLVCVVNGVRQPIGFDFKSIKSDEIESVNIYKLDNDEKRADLIAKRADLITKYGKDAGNGVLFITTKKKN